MLLSLTINAQNKNKYSLIIPNAFTPNSDGFNDVFLPVSLYDLNNENYSMQIYNRKGMLIFESNSSVLGWDGKTFSGDKVASGVYIYIIQYSILIKTFITYKNQEVKGYVTLLR